MCLIGFALKSHPQYPLIIVSNRDEHYHRPALPAQWWDNGIHGGQDLEQGGTWLAVSRDGRFGAITNYRSAGPGKETARSRGELIVNYLSNTIDPESYLETVKTAADLYRGFNLVLGDQDGLIAYSNIDGEEHRAGSGIHGLSNGFFNTSWPKVDNLKAGLASSLDQNKDVSFNELFGLLRDTTRPSDQDLPDTGVGKEVERALSPAFIEQDNYGTRASTVIALSSEGKVTFEERSFKPEILSVRTEFTISRNISRDARNQNLSP